MLAAGPRKPRGDLAATLRGRYLNAHPSAEAFVDFKDFSFFRIVPSGPIWWPVWPHHRSPAGAVLDRYRRTPRKLLAAEQALSST